MATLGYWDTRGLAQPIRLLLKYVGVPFNDKRYAFGEGILTDVQSIRKNWLLEKHSLDLDFPNLPYFIDSDVKITQSLAILRYLARKHGLSATEEPYIAQQDMVEQQLKDLNHSFFKVLISDSENFEKNKNSFINDALQSQLQLLSKFLGSKEWLIGELSYVDFIAYESMDRFRLLSPETVEKFENLVEYHNRFESLPPITIYMNSNEFKSWPLFGPIAKWGYNK